jgi:hypothetical protein
MYDNSTPISGKVSSGIGALITAINNFPQEWALTPCIGKRNLWQNWNTTKLDRDRVWLKPFDRKPTPRANPANGRA